MNRAARETLIEQMIALADGERAVFDEVYAALWPLARALGRRLVGDEGDDVAQAALLKLFEESHRYRRGADPVPWLLALVGWEARTLRKRRQRRREAPMDDEPAVPSHAVDIERRQLVEAALEVLGSLDERDREVLRLAFEDQPRPPLTARLRKQKQRSLTRLREAFRRTHG